MASKSRHLRGRAIISEPITKDAGIVEHFDSYSQAFNAGRLREIRLLTTGYCGVKALSGFMTFYSIMTFFYLQMLFIEK
jgi:hypothetical protein